MNFTRNRLRSRNHDERNSGISTRSTSTTEGNFVNKKRNAKADDTKTTGLSGLLHSPKSLTRTPKLKNNSTKLKKNNILSALVNIDEKKSDTKESICIKNTPKTSAVSDHPDIDENKSPDVKSTSGKSGNKLLVSIFV